MRRSAYDPDELEEEQRERDRRNKKNKEYKKFAMRIQEEAEKTPHTIEVDIPYKDLVSAQAIRPPQLDAQGRF